MNAIRGGLAYIAKQQLKNGGFRSYRLGKSGILKSKSYETTFIPSLILLALQDVPGGKSIKRAIASFLIKQASEAWTWNYWDRHSQIAKMVPLPDDVDASFVAMTALYGYDKKLLTPTRMAQMTNTLFATEVEPGGPYRTWIVDESASARWRDIDIVVNINIAGFLARQGVSLESLNHMIEMAIETKTFNSPYYPSLQPALYLLARWYDGPSKGALRELILRDRKKETWGDPHHTALAVSALLRLGYEVSELETAIAYLRSSQAGDGGWSAGEVCVDVKRDGEEVLSFVGSDALTTALCVEAIRLYEMHIKQAKRAPSRTNRRYILVTKHAQHTIDELPHRELRTQTYKVLERILAQDKDRQIVMLPWLVARAARTKTGEALLHKLAVASLWGWTAYTIYDDFLDNEGDPAFLPSAVFAQRQLIATFEDILPDDKTFHDEIRWIMNRLDQANAWEVAHCRGVITENRLYIDKLPDYGDYWQLADRSLGHTIAGMGVFYGDKRDEKSRQALRDFFRHYLIARQLNDDAHDWEDDLALGHVNAVAVQILQAWTASHSLKKGIGLEDDLEELRTIMWQDVLDHVCGDILLHVVEAKRAIKKAGMNEVVLLPMLDPLEAATKRALRTRDEAREFIASL